MKITQVAEILNSTIHDEITGESAVVKEDLSNIVDVGKTVLDYTADQKNFDNFMGKLIDRIGKVTFVDRVYTSMAPNILHDGWEYGSIMMKVRAEVPDYSDNKTWYLGGQSIKADGTGVGQDTTTIDPFEISKPSATAKFYNRKTTFELPITIAEVQLKEAFTSAAEMNRFISTIQNRISLKATLATDALIMRTINNLIGQKINKGNNVVNLLKEYNTAASAQLTAEQAIANPDFLRFAAKTIMLYKKYLNNASMLYNDDGYVTFTPDERMKFVMLSEFAKGLEVYLYTDTYHNEFVKLDGYSEVPFWQGTGTDSSFKERSTIDITTDNGISTTDIKQEYVVGVIFDEQAAAVCNENQRVTSIWNPKGEYWNYFYKYDSSYMNDTAENCVVFTLADKSEE